MALKEYTLNIDLVGPINNVINLFIDQTRISYFGTSNGLEHNHLLVIELEHLIFGFDRTDIEHQTYLIRPITRFYVNTLIGEKYSSSKKINRFSWYFIISSMMSHCSTKLFWLSNRLHSKFSEAGMTYNNWNPNPIFTEWNEP